ncbi:MAG: serine hydrolase [Bacteroidales bacterium]|nr:serine hydrolase [Lachnoclostridium sp.]MCM1382947.1 serine hydrolase [Lachnoclostridium sp.]MCM1464000.1 serine hydrolase [Bacteroidales bacterium]
MRCTNKIILEKITATAVLAAVGICLTGCGSDKYAMAYQMDSEVSSFNVLAFDGGNKVTPFAEDLCIVSEDVAGGTELDMSLAESAVLFDLNNRDVLYAKNAHAQMNPASLTKIMTALVAIKYGSSEQVLTATDAVIIKESGTQVCGVKSGDTMTMDQALHILLMYSANDVALLIAENVGGSVEEFVNMMNREAASLGATNTHFANPHGLTDEEHYTTAYDLYLIFNEAIKYESINEIIHMSNYQTTYYDKSGRAKELKVKNSNGFLNGNANANAPENVTVIGGKTGTTNAAGNCLMLLSKDVNGAPYISVILKAQSSDALYQEMSDLLKEITN